MDSAEAIDKPQDVKIGNGGSKTTEGGSKTSEGGSKTSDGGSKTTSIKGGSFNPFGFGGSSRKDDATFYDGNTPSLAEGAGKVPEGIIFLNTNFRIKKNSKKLFYLLTNILSHSVKKIL